MEINYEYVLNENNYISSETVKKSIILGNMPLSPDKNFLKWRTRYNGNYKKTAAFTIDVAGSIYNHFNPKYSSTILNNVELDKRNIVILLENEGWLSETDEKNRFIDWVGHIYMRPDEVIKKKWRGQIHWAPYTENQIESAVKLVNKLCDEFTIKKFVIPHNTKVEDNENFEGIFYRSNLEKYYTDLSPAWPCENFKYKFEKNEKN